MTHDPARNGLGRLQAAMPKGERVSSARRAYGLNLRGAVVRIYPRDTPPPGTPNPAATYASVLTYGALGRRLLPRVQIKAEHASLYTGTMGGLRAASLTLGGGVLDLDHMDPASLDCSHVVVSFFDDDLSQPYISGLIEHPRADGGDAISGDVQDRTRLASTDGAPLLVRWNGCTWGVDGTGDYMIDLERAHDGTLTSDGAEPPPATDGSRGNLRVSLPAGSRVVVQIGGAPAVVLEESGADGRLVLGDGAVSVAVAEPLQALYEALTQWIYTTLILATPQGPSQTAQASGVPAPPSWDTAITSTHIQLPEA